MGVDVDFYVVHGRKVPFDNDFLEAYDDDYTKNGRGNTVEVIIDGMMGDYIVVGEVQCRFGEYEGNDWAEVDVSNLAEEEKAYKEKFRKAFPAFAHWMDEPFNLIAFKHYS